MEKALKLYNSQGAFPSAENQIEIFGFNYDAKRMGGAPIITATVMYGSCLDEVWTDDVYVEFNGEKYYLKQTPTSSFSNADARYKHECEFVSERIKLDNVYFFDTVVGDPQGYDKPVSNSSVFSFFGNIREFAKRLNASLQYSKLQTKNDDGTYSGYIVIVNNDVDNEEKLLSFSNVPFSTALQESYNQFEIPYYFVGKEIHFGYWQEVIEEPFRYGVDKELLSITKTNANQKVITRCTGIGGTENIPYYYPNKHPQGELIPLYNNAENVVSIEDEALFAKNILLTDKVEYTETRKTDIALGANSTFYNIYDYNKWAKEKGRKADWREDSNWFVTPNLRMPKTVKEKYATASMGGYEPYDDNIEHINFNKDNPSIAFRIALNEGELSGKSIKITLSSDEINFDDATTNQNGVKTHIDYDVECYVNTQGKYAEDDEATGSYVTFGTIKIGSVERRDGKAIISFEYKINDAWWDKSVYIVIKKRSGWVYNSEIDPKNLVISIDSVGVTAHIDFDAELIEPIISYYWQKNDRYYSLSDLGLSNVPQPTVGDIISFEQSAYVQPMPNLMPPIYWESNGEERFYNALNSTYDNPETGDKYTFANPYSDSKRVEHIVEFPDIKPTIEGMTNNAGQPINAFLEFAYDEEDNDAIDQNGNYIHPYFYAKLPKFDSFNLFTHANEKGEVTFSMKSGNCGACNFVLGVNAESGKNDLQVDDKGKLLFENGVAKRGAPQDKQNDTKNNEVWVALKKDNSTFGTIMPSAQHKYYPKPCTKNADGSYNADGDTFVLLNITMPIEYVKAAENRLKEEIIKYMYENNVEKFSFSIKFSRIYLAENPQILEKLNENAFITVEYNGEEHSLYVNSFAYKMTAGEALPEITIELAETLSASMNAIQAAVSQVKTDVLDRVQKMDIATMVAANFVSKNSEDYAKQKITFNRGISVGTQDAEVAKIDQMGHAEIESATLKQYISSPTFRDGFSGEGFKMWLDENGLSHLTVDVLTARQRMVIYEMLVEKSRSVNGGLWVSSANGRISDVVDNVDNYEIYFEDINTFVKGDYMRCQVYTGVDMKSYWVEVTNVDGGVVLVSKEEFALYNTLPQIGDDVFLCGSKNVNRQNAIHIRATEDGQPRISIYNGISTKNLAGCLRTQLGNLDGIVDSYFEDAGIKVQGDGLYSDNAFLKGDFILRNSGLSVDTMFAVTEEGIKASVEQTQNIESQNSVLHNASFTKGLNGWITENMQSALMNTDHLLLKQENVLLKDVTVYAKHYFEDNTFFVRLGNSWIKQYNWQFENKPPFQIGSQYSVTIKINIKPTEGGRLFACLSDSVSDEFEGIYLVNVENINTNGYLYIRTGNIDEVSKVYMVEANTAGIYAGSTILVDVNNNMWRLVNNETWSSCDVIENGYIGLDGSLTEYPNLAYSIVLDRELSAGERYQILSASAKWYGNGDFILYYANGNADISYIQLYSNETEVRYSTLFEQTDKVISLVASATDKDGNIISISEIKQTAEGLKTRVEDFDGRISTIEQTAEGLKTRVEDVETVVVDLGGDIETINGDILGIKDKQYSYDAQQSELKISIEGISTTVQGLIAKDAELESDIEGAGIHISAVEQKADSISQRVAESVSKNIVYNGNFEVYDTDNTTAEGWSGNFVGVTPIGGRSCIASTYANAIFKQSKNVFKDTDFLLHNASVSASNPYNCVLSFEHLSTNDNVLRFYKAINDFDTENPFDRYSTFVGYAEITSNISFRAGKYAIMLNGVGYNSNGLKTFFRYDNQNKKIYISGSTTAYDIDSATVYANIMGLFDKAPELYFEVKAFDLVNTDGIFTKETITIEGYGEIFHDIYFSLDELGSFITNIRLFPTGDNLPVLYGTYFEQTSKMVNIVAKQYFNDDGSINSDGGLVSTDTFEGLFDGVANEKGVAYLSGVVAKPNGVGIYAIDGSTGEAALFATYIEDGISKIKLQADEIVLETSEGHIGEFEISENGLTYEAGAYTASFTKEAFVLGGEIEYSGLVGRTKTFTVRGEDSINDVSPLITAERNLPTGEQNFANVPIFRIQDNSSFSTVAIETTGAIHCNGSFIQRGALLKLTDAQSPNLIEILKNTLWVISNNYQSNAFVYLPRLTRVRKHLNINNDEFFAIPIEVLSTPNSQYDSLITVESESGESAYQYKIIDWNGGSNNYQRLSKGDSMRFLLIYDGETYYAQILRSTN